MRTIIGGLVVVASAGLLAAAVAQSVEEKVPLDKLPKGVLDTVKTRFNGAEMLESVKEVKTFYEVTIRHKGQKIDVTLEGGEIARRVLPREPREKKALHVVPRRALGARERPEQTTRPRRPSSR